MFSDSLSVFVEGDAVVTVDGHAHSVRYKLEAEHLTVPLSDYKLLTSEAQKLRALVQGSSEVMADIQKQGTVMLAVFDIIMEIPVVGMTEDGLSIRPMGLLQAIARNAFPDC
jgi:hypothetical protein